MRLNCNQSGILQQRTQNVELKKRCVKLLEEFGSLSYTRQTLEKLDAELRTDVAKHGGNPLLDYILDKLMGWRKWADENKLVQ
jgi:geranylgeranyl diphosphate synthase type 3